MKQNMNRWLLVAGALALALEVAPAFGQAPVIASFGRNGELVCTNLLLGSTANVVWASSVLGPWTNTLAAPTDSNGVVRATVPLPSVSVPMFYRVMGVPPPDGMVLIPAGNFVMGNTPGSSSGEQPLHTNYVSAFYMDQYEVTKALWDGVYTWATNHGYSFDYSDSGQGKAANHPVQTVTWYDCVKWCNARSEKEGKTPAYYTSAAQTTVYRTGRTNVQNDWVKWSRSYRLPTEAEWEKAARGGVSGQRFPWGNTISWSQANYYTDPMLILPYDLNPLKGYHPTFATGGYPYTSPVGYFAPNGFGLYDMAGNVWERCWDWYGSYSSESQIDPRGPISGLYRVIRGGSWRGDAAGCRSPARGYGYPSDYSYYGGFRVVLAPGQ